MSYTKDQLEAMYARISDSDKTVYREQLNAVKSFLDSRGFQYTIEDKSNHGKVVVSIPRQNNFIHFVLGSKHIILASRNSPNVHLNATDFVWINSKTKSPIKYNSIKHLVTQIDINYSYKELNEELVKRFDMILLYMNKSEHSFIRETESKYLVPRYDKKHNIMHWLKTENDKKKEMKQRVELTKKKR